MAALTAFRVGCLSRSPQTSASLESAPAKRGSETRSLSQTRIVSCKFWSEVGACDAFQGQQSPG